MYPRELALFIRILICFLALSLSSVSISQEIEETSEPAQEQVDEQETVQEENHVLEVNPAQEEALKELLFVPVTFREQVAFKVYFTSEAGRTRALNKAGESSIALEKAMNANRPLESDSPAVEVLTRPNGKIEIKIRGYKIIDLDPIDQPERGYESAAEYAERLRSDLSSFVSEELDRIKIQRGALKFFLSIFFALIGFVVFRQVHQSFNNAELVLEQKRGSFKPVVILSETLVSGQALGGLLALSLAIGRMLAYIIVILSTFAAILGQFSTSREILTQFLSKTLSQFFYGFQTLLESIPGLVLALFLFVGFQLSLKILDLFLKGVRSGRISIIFLTSSRIPIIRFWGTALLLVLFAPLIVASVFGRFHTPLETVVLLATAALALAALPVLITVAIGSFVLWQGVLEPGQWIEIGDKSGEISNVTLYRVTIVPESGGRIYIPMIQLLFYSCFERKAAPKAEFQIKIKRENTIKNTTELLDGLFPKELEVSVACLSMSATEYLYALYAPQFQRDIRSEVLSILDSAHENGRIQLTSEMIKEVRH